MTIHNLIPLYIIKFTRWFMLYMPISYLFYLENGFSEFEYLTLHAVYSGVIAFSEVPSGYCADVMGRKISIWAGTLFGTLGFTVYGLSHGLWFFLIAEILLGIGTSLISGADSAMLYDSLLEQKKENKYLKHEGFITALGNFSEVAAALIVSLIALSPHRNYFQLQMLIAFAGFGAAFFLKEPKIHEKKMTGSFSEIIYIIKFIFTENKNLRNLIIFSSIIGFASLSMAWLAQPVIKEMGVIDSDFGYIWAFLNLMVMFGSMSAINISKRYGFKSKLLYIAVPMCCGFLFLCLHISIYSFIILVIFYFVRGTAHPILKKYIHENTTSEKRATVLSVRSLIIRIMFLVIGPLLGIVTEKLSLKFGLLLCGLSVIIPSIILIIMLFHSQDNNR